MALLRWCAAIVACCHCVSAALVPSDIVSTLAFANGTVVDASPLVRMALAGAPDGQGFSPSYALGRSGTFLYHPKATDGGDTACQGAVNVDQIGLLATPDLQPGLCLSVRPSVRLPACLSACLPSLSLSLSLLYSHTASLCAQCHGTGCCWRWCASQR